MRARRAFLSSPLPRRAVLVLAVVTLAPLPVALHSLAAAPTSPEPFFTVPDGAFGAGLCEGPAVQAAPSARQPAGTACSPPPVVVPPAEQPTGPLAGKVVAFTSALDLIPANDGGQDGLRGGIYVVGADGSAPRKIVTYATLRRSAVAHTFQEPDDHPSISPNGRRIVWTSNRADLTQGVFEPERINWDIWVADINGQNAQQLTTAPGVDTEPTWSPDGSQIYWATGTDPFFGEGDLDIWRMNADGSGKAPVIAGPRPEFEPDVSPDGKQVAFTRDYGGLGYRGYEIVVRRLSPAAETRLTSNNDGDHDAHWSGSGARLFISSEHANIKQPYGDIYRLNPANGEVISRTTDNPLLSRGDPAVSSDSKIIAAMQPILPVARGPHVIEVMDVDGNHLERVGGPGLVDIHPSVGVRADADGDGTPDYLESGSVGRPKLVVPARVRALRPFVVKFAWTHPVAWRTMDAMELVVTGPKGPIGAFRLLIGSGRISAWDNRAGGYVHAAVPGGRRILRSGGMRLDLSRTRVEKTSTATITAVLGLRMTRALQGRAYGIQVQANDLDGDHQGERIAGMRIRVGR